MINKLSLPWKLVLSLVFGLLTTVSFYRIGLTFSGDAYYYTLSSIFQGLFSILALAGIFIIFKIEQLSKDIAQYDRDIRNELLPKLYGSAKIGYEIGYEIREGLSLDLDQRNMRDYENKLKVLEIEIKKNGGVGDINRYDLCIEKGRRIRRNIELRSEILECFKLPFIKGMLLLMFVLYFLPKPNSNSSIFLLNIPMEIIIGASVIFTIMVLLEIAYIIYRSICEVK